MNFPVHSSIVMIYASEWVVHSIISYYLCDWDFSFIIFICLIFDNPQVPVSGLLEINTYFELRQFAIELALVT